MCSADEAQLLFFVSTVLFVKRVNNSKICEDNASELTQTQLKEKICNIGVFLHLEREPKIKLM